MTMAAEPIRAAITLAAIPARSAAEPRAAAPRAVEPLAEPEARTRVRAAALTLARPAATAAAPMTTSTLRCRVSPERGFSPRLSHCEKLITNHLSLKQDEKGNMEIGYSDFNIYFNGCWNFPRSDKLHELRRI